MTTTHLTPAEVFARECGICLDDLAADDRAEVLASWADLLAEVGEIQRDAFVAFASADRYWVNGYGVPDFSSFEESYAGEWDSFRDYADDLADQIGLMGDVPEWAQSYFDMSAWARDLAYDYTTENAPHGGVFVFRSL